MLGSSKLKLEFSVNEVEEGLVKLSATKGFANNSHFQCDIQMHLTFNFCAITSAHIS